jgi:ribonuclease P protein component
MFSKKHRITKRLFEEVFSNGKTIKTNYFLLKYRTNEENIVRVSVVASKKIFKTAVLRNKVKRKFKAILKETNLIQTNNDLIFILNKNIEIAKRKDVTLIINQIRLK